MEMLSSAIGVVCSIGCCLGSGAAILGVIYYMMKGGKTYEEFGVDEDVPPALPVDIPAPPETEPDLFDDEEMATVVAPPPPSLMKDVPSAPPPPPADGASPPRSSGQTIIAFDDEEDDW